MHSLDSPILHLDWISPPQEACPLMQFGESYKITIRLQLNISFSDITIETVNSVLPISILICNIFSNIWKSFTVTLTKNKTWFLRPPTKYCHKYEVKLKWAWQWNKQLLKFYFSLLQYLSSCKKIHSEKS